MRKTATLRGFASLSLFAALFAASACEGTGDTANGLTLLPDTTTQDPVNPPGSVTPPDDGTGGGGDTGGGNPAYTTAILLFNGAGVSTSDWQSTEQIIKSQGLSYRLVNSAQMNAMPLAELATFGAIVVPGGSGGTITSNLTTAARLRIREAVRDHGVGYVGFCAGAWVAVGPEAGTSSVAGYGLAVAPGEVLPSYYPGGNTSLTAAMVDTTFADGSRRKLVWWGGPATPEWTGGVVARYVTGAPAISEMLSGKGYVVISGPHPEAPQGWRLTAGTDSDGLDFDIAAKMIYAALTRQPMAAF